MASVKVPHTVPCSNCQAPKLPHNVCKECGNYDGRQVLELKDEE
jgi:large subunit ribosomal protein L32